jgi:MarR family transcriptional regulator, organic hydroperoxide resistance regulator
MPPRTRPTAPQNVAPDDGSIRAAIKQTKPFRSQRQEALVGLLLTAEAVRWPLHDLLASHEDLTLQQYNVLRILRGAGQEGLPTLAIGERMIERTPGVTRLIDRMEEKGLVVRERSPEDRRQVICRITELGANLLRRLDRPVDALDEDLMRGLDDAEVREFIRLLDAVRRHNTRGR